jgi:hypothetical protein
MTRQNRYLHPILRSKHRPLPIRKATSSGGSVRNCRLGQFVSAVNMPDRCWTRPSRPAAFAADRSGPGARASRLLCGAFALRRFGRFRLVNDGDRQKTRRGAMHTRIGSGLGCRSAAEPHHIDGRRRQRSGRSSPPPGGSSVCPLRTTSDGAPARSRSPSAPSAHIAPSLNTN